MKVLAYLAAAACFGLGLLFLIASFPSGPHPFSFGRLITAAALGVLGWFIIRWVQARPIIQTVEIKHTLDAPGELKLQEMRCRQCSGTLGKDNITVAEGGISVKCPYCGSVYQMEEAPKW